MPCLYFPCKYCVRNCPPFKLLGSELVGIGKPTQRDIRHVSDGTTDIRGWVCKYNQRSTLVWCVCNNVSLPDTFSLLGTFLLSSRRTGYIAPCSRNMVIWSFSEEICQRPNRRSIAYVTWCGILSVHHSLHHGIQTSSSDKRFQIASRLPAWGQAGTEDGDNVTTVPIPSGWT
jgi:hypothetical protein